MAHEPERERMRCLNELSRKVIGVAIGVHEAIGPGILEAPYRDVLAARLRNAGHAVAVEVPMPLEIDGMRFEVAYRADMVVDGVILVEVKAVPELVWRHLAQVKTYVRIGGYPLGLLFNFHAPKLYLDGIKRIIP